MKLRSVIKLIRNSKAGSYRKGDVLIPEGASGKDVFFIRKGLVRAVLAVEDKLETTTFQLYPEHNVVLNLHAILFDEPSRFSYEALENTKVYRIDYASLLELTKRDQELLELNRTYFGRNAMRRAFQRVESFVFLSPEERYVQYVRDYPQIVHRAPDKYIAHVLGITPVSLSRIRARIASRKS